MYQWEILNEYEEGKNVVTQILESRGYESKNEQEIFLHPPSAAYWFRNLPRDLLLSLKKARRLVKKAMEQERAIIVHGDYDADGICATAILTKTLSKELAYENVFPFIPNRFEHGYGLSQKSITASLAQIPADLQEKGVLVITVDSGITSINEIASLKGMGHEVIITDHHQKPEQLPPADIVVWYDQVVGATLSWLLAKVLGAKDKQLLALSALATITDLQPVTDFNRTIVRDGLVILNDDPPLGLKILMEIAGKKGKEVTTYDLGWLIGPRLNASGRVEDASLSLDLLLEEDEESARKIAWQLNKVNSERQDKTFEMYDIATTYDEKDLPHIIISHHENYHEGIIGLVASRLTKKYHRPSIVISTSEDVYKGSVRSIPGVNIIEFLREMEEMFVSLGGHPMAAGFSIEAENFEEFLKKTPQLATTNIDEKYFTRILEIDMLLPASLINQELVEELDKLRPYGLGNDQPVFATKKMGVANSNYVGRENQHLSLRLFDGGNIQRAILFNAEDHGINLKEGDMIDIAYTLKTNHYNGNVYLDLILKDIKKSA